eukprot:2362565-Rhodomonas_salina.2
MAPAIHLLLAAAGVAPPEASEKPAPEQALPPLPISIASTDSDIHLLVEDTAEDCRALCIEKNGEAPDDKVLSAPDLPPRDAPDQPRAPKHAP